MSNPSTPSSAPVVADRPWWREYMLWLVIGGPAVVVVASFVTLSLAIRHPDPVLEPGVSSSLQTSAGRSGGAEDGHQAPDAAAYQPAIQGRNHAATGGSPSK